MGRKCKFCDQESTKICGFCEAPICDQHMHPLDRWHNVYHARWICPDCYQQRQRKKKYVIVPLMLFFAILLYFTMNVQFGLNQPSLWQYLLAIVTLPTFVLGFGTFYHLITRSPLSAKLLKMFLPLLVLWLIILSISQRIS